MFFRSAVLVVLLLACGPKAEDSAAPPDLSWFDAVDLGFSIQHQPIDALSGTGISVNDIDGDGFEDLLLAPGQSPMLRFKGTDTGWIPWPDDPVWPATSAPLLADFDGDLDPDLLLPLSPGFALYRNEAGTFTDVTAQSGLADLVTEGVVHLLAADLDADGFTDVYVSSQAGPNPVLWGSGALRFEPEISSPISGDEATWSDFTGDGWPDLYTTTDTLALDYGLDPESAEPSPEPEHDRLYAWIAATNSHADFGDVSRTVGIAGRRSSMGAVPLHTTDRVLPSIFIPDFGRNQLLEPSDDGFVPATLAAGLDVAIHNTGACAEPDGDLRPCLLVSWSALSADWSGDSLADLLVFNGGIEPGEIRLQPATAYDLQGGTESTGQGPASARTATLILRNGSPDVLWTEHSGDVHLWRSRSSTPHQALRLDSNQGSPDGSGAVIIDGHGRRHWVAAGGVTGVDPSPIQVVPGTGPLTILWPSGQRQTVTDASAWVSEPERVSLSTQFATTDGSPVRLTIGDGIANNASISVTGPVTVMGPEAVGTDRVWQISSDIEGDSRVFITVDSALIRYAPRIYWRP